MLAPNYLDNEQPSGFSIVVIVLVIIILWVIL